MSTPPRQTSALSRPSVEDGVMVKRWMRSQAVSICCLESWLTWVSARCGSRSRGAAAGQDGRRQQVAQLGVGRAVFGQKILQRRPGQVVDDHGLAFAPVVGRLEHSRAGDAPVGEEQGIGEARAARLHGGGQGVARHLGAHGLAVAGKDQRHEPGPRRDELQPVLPGQLKAEVRSTGLGPGRAAQGQDQLVPGQLAPGGPHVERAFARHAADGPPQEQLRARAGGPLLQCARHAPGPFQGEELAVVALLIGDPVLAQEPDHVPGGEPRQGGLHEMRIGADVVGRPGVQVGEIAPPAAGDADLARGLGPVIDHGHPQPTARGGHGAPQAGCPGSQDDDVVSVHGPVLRQDFADRKGRGIVTQPC
ncbi:hypothetical protein AWY79_04305 [Pseudodesulfovibrio indicus]|uniref:Uncharacterized protein n=1 Tax=Pseudodesulfovibrio indicus TaxID=1716143 RepID=A0ABM5YSQ1_9BACT|nr:hypothetical protein AWY79_04305 [Pseudodesulfovibrio indicus]